MFTVLYIVTRFKDDKREKKAVEVDIGDNVGGRSTFFRGVRIRPPVKLRYRPDHKKKYFSNVSLECSK